MVTSLSSTLYITYNYIQGQNQSLFTHIGIIIDLRTALKRVSQVLLHIRTKYDEILGKIKSSDTKFFFIEYIFTPINHPQNISQIIFFIKSLKNDSKIVSALSTTIARSRLLLLIEFPLWLPPSQRFSSHLSVSQSPLPVLSAIYPRSWLFSKFPKSPKA